MSTQSKSVLTFLGGAALGLFLGFIFAFGYFVATSSGSGNSEATENKDLKMFDSPKQVINAETFRIMQVLPDGSALATSNDLISKPGMLEYGTVVMFRASDEQSYYDDQIISVSKGHCFKQIGTYHYVTTKNVDKTVPVVEMFEK